MTTVAIFGTGTSGERAWRSATARNDIRVVAFADNDARKQGTTLHDVPVLAAEALPALACDQIVLASMYAPDIHRQLRALGVAEERIAAPDLNRFAEVFAALAQRKRLQEAVALDDGSSLRRSELPAVLILTFEAIDSSHGTGILLQRYFRDFPPERLCNLCLARHGEAWLSNTILLRPGASVQEDAAALHQELTSRDFRPSLIYATAFNENDLALLEAALAALPPRIPVIQHFMDYTPHDHAAFDQAFNQLAPRVDEVWALAEGMARELARRYRRPVAHVGALHQVPPSSAKETYAESGPDFRAVMLGNVWRPHAMAFVRKVWAHCRLSIPDLPAIAWHVHPMRAQALLETGQELGDEIVWRGFYEDEALQERLRGADLAIVPFNSEATATEDYARFSLPSRLTELCGAGLPIALLASPDTEPAHLLAQHDCGATFTGPEAAHVAEELVVLIRDRARREHLGRRARRIAETVFALGPFELWLRSVFVRLARRFDWPSDWTGPRSENLTRLAGSGRATSARLDEVFTDRVHYACGRNVLPGWLNLDGFDESYPSGDVPPELAARIFRLDLTGPHPFPDNSFRLGYCEDFIEHIDQPALVAFLCECHRTFRHGGVLRLSSPGLDGILRDHLHGSGYPAAAALEADAYRRWWHKHFLCFEEIAIIAHRIGWREVRACRYGESDIPDLRQETRPGQTTLNLVVELVK